MRRSFEDEYDEYIEDLFQAQFEISERVITHSLEKGQTREDFIKDEIEKRFHNINLRRGFISGMDRLSRQADILILRQNAQNRGLGQNFIASVQDILMVIEVKSNATGTDIKKYCNDVEIIKQQNPGQELPMFGMFCYRVKSTRKTIYKRFGYEYDEQNDLIVYAQDANLTANSDYSGLSLSYSNLDFFLSIHPASSDVIEDRFMFFRKAIDRNGNPYFVSYKERPITKHLWGAIQGGL